jgi:phosphoglycerate-specific signal transduction histidine kinase
MSAPPKEHGVLSRLYSSAFSVWGRLFASFLLIAAIMSAVASITVVEFTDISAEMEAMVSEQMPEMVKVNEVAARVTELASLATLLSEPQLRADRSNFQFEITARLSGLKASLRNLAVPELETLNAEIAEHVAQVLQLADAQFAAENALMARAADLRWFQADFQGEISPLLLDISFNIDNAVTQLAQAKDQQSFDVEFTLLRVETAKRDLVQEIGREGSFAINAMLQATSAQSMESLAQFEDIGAESLDRADRLMSELGSADALITLRQSLESLRELAASQTGIFELGRQTIEGRGRTLEALAATQKALLGFQEQLSALGATRRDEANKSAARAINNMQSASLRIVALTVAGLLAMVAIVVFYVRRRIVLRLRGLSHALRAIARGETEALALEKGSDEIGRMANAVEVFRQSVKEREQTLEQLRAEVEMRKKAHEQLEQTQAELVQAGKLAALGQLSAGISHELNQPIAAVRYAAHNGMKRIEQGADDPKLTQKAFGKIMKMTDRMGALVKQFAHFARRSDYKIAPMVLLPSVKRAGELFQSRFDEQKHIRLTIKQSSLEHRVLADPLLVEQVIVNLISNAADAIEAAERKVGTIEIFGEIAANRCAIHIVDNGVGLPTNKPDIFDPFVTTKEVGKGTGLGLSISYSIAQDLGGTLRLENNHGDGATAIFELELTK